MSIIKQQSCNLVWYRNADVFNNPVFTYRPGYETWHAYNKYSNKQFNSVKSLNERCLDNIKNSIGDIISWRYVNLNEYGKGIYLIEMFNNHSIKTQKIIIE